MSIQPYTSVTKSQQHHAYMQNACITQDQRLEVGELFVNSSILSVFVCLVALWGKPFYASVFQGMATCKFLLPPVRIRIFGPKRPNVAQNLHFLLFWA